MAMINLKDPQMLRDAANRVDSKVAAVNEKLSKLQATYDQLFEVWNDKHSEELRETLEGIKAAMQQITEKAGEMKTMLNNEAAKAEEVQSKISARHGNTETINMQ